MAKTAISELLLFDDFAPDAAEVREAVISWTFATHRGPDGAEYTGISSYPVPQWFNRIAECIGKKIIPRLSCFRLNLKGENPHSWVHSDDICAKYASVLYLNSPEQCKGGTAFWSHVELGENFLPSKEALRNDGIDADAFYAKMSDEWKILSRWKQDDFVPMKWNRFITYPTCYFHSRYPHEAFGDGPSDGRLIWICFYDVEGQ
jgi:hypothetical protein